MKIDKEKVDKILNDKKIIKKFLIASIGLTIVFYCCVFSFDKLGFTAGADIMMQWVNICAGVSVVIYLYMMFKFDKKNAKKKIDKKDLVHFADYQTTAYCGNKDAMNLSKDWNKVNCADCLEKNITVTLEQQLESEVVSPEKENEKEEGINTKG
ncbi:hypothetical protein KAU43_05080 [candidate division WOR-3 bacterium]|nr:hypothetical protein [candidate division WOR-3 bacterium]